MTGGEHVRRGGGESGGRVAATGLGRVLFVNSSARLGGGNRFVAAVGSELARRGIGVKIAFLDDGPAVAAARQLGLDAGVWRIAPPDKAHPLRSGVGFVRARRLVRLARPHVVHANDIVAARAVAIASRVHRVPLVCHNHSGEPLTEREVGWAFRRLPAPRVFVDASPAVADRNAALLRNCYANSGHALLRNGVETAVPSSGGGAWRRIGCVANLLPVKRHEDFLSMARLLADALPGLEFWIVGDESLDAEYAAALRAQRERLGLRDQVHFLGRRDDVASVLASLDIFVHCSEREATPFAVLEAMAASLPVVATRVGGVPYVIAAEVDGLLVPPRRPDLLAEAVERLLRDRVAARAFAMNGRQRAEQEFDVRKSVDALLAIYDDARSI